MISRCKKNNSNRRLLSVLLYMLFYHEFLCCQSKSKPIQFSNETTFTLSTTSSTESLRSFSDSDPVIESTTTQTPIEISDSIVIDPREEQSRNLVTLANGDFVTRSELNVYLWDINRTIIKETLNNSTSYLSCLLLLPNDQLLIGEANGRIMLWNLKNKSTEIIFNSENMEISCIVLLPDGTVAISQDASLKILNLTNRTILKNFTFDSRVGDLKIVQNSFLVLGSFLHLRVFNLDEGRVVRVLPEKRLISLGVLNDGTLVSSSYEHIKLWNVTTGALIGEIFQSNMFNVNALIALGDEYLAAACGDRTIKIWNVKDKTLRMILEGHTKEVTFLTVFPNGNLLSTSLDRSLRIWKNPLNFL